MAHSAKVVTLAICSAALWGCATRQEPSINVESKVPLAVPFHIEDGSMLLTVRINDVELPFIFDTGLSGYNVLTRTAATSLHLTPSGSEAVGGSGVGEVIAGFARIHGMQLGRQMLVDQTVAIVPVREDVVKRRAGPPIAGFLGQALLNGNVTCADFDRSQLTFWPPEDFSPRLPPLTMAMYGELPTLDILVDGTSATLAIDTGDAGGITLFPEFVSRHQLRLHYSNLTSGKSSGAVGSSYTTETTRALKVKIGAADIANAPLTFSDRGGLTNSSVDGRIGLGVLAIHGFCMDLNRKRFYLGVAADRPVGDN